MSAYVLIQMPDSFTKCDFQTSTLWSRCKEEKGIPVQVPLSPTHGFKTNPQQAYSTWLPWTHHPKLPNRGSYAQASFMRISKCQRTIGVIKEFRNLVKVHKNCLLSAVILSDSGSICVFKLSLWPAARCELAQKSSQTTFLREIASERNTPGKMYWTNL